MIAGHELGHYLLLADNLTYTKSIMNTENRFANYFIWGVETPNSLADWPPVHRAYPGGPN